MDLVILREKSWYKIKKKYILYVYWFRYVFIFWEYVVKKFVIEWILCGKVLFFFEFSLRKYMYINICGIIRICVCLMFIDFVDFIINGFKFILNYE